MKKTDQAVLLSALIFPGSGHFFLKRYFVGLLLAGIALVASYFLISGMIVKALELADKIKSGKIPPDYTAITELFSQQSAGIDLQSLNTAIIFLLAAWLVGVVDSYRVGRQLDNKIKTEK
jgi:uncharacterized SAM-binding protein YcdF (DUF218 family)